MTQNQYLKKINPAVLIGLSFIGAIIGALFFILVTQGSSDSASHSKTHQSHQRLVHKASPPRTREKIITGWNDPNYNSDNRVEEFRVIQINGSCFVETFVSGDNLAMTLAGIPCPVNK